MRSSTKHGYLALAFSAALAVGATGCGLGEPAGPSLDQQQQAWEQDLRNQACESLMNQSPGSVELGWLYEGGADGLSGNLLGQVAAKRPYNCNDDRFDRWHQERLQDEFPDSPKGRSGETTAPAP